MSRRVCPWWLGYFLLNPFRRRGQNPEQILSPYVREGMTVLEPGPGMGFFTLELARLAGPSGRVIAIDVQEKMLERLKRRAAKAGLLDRIDVRVAADDSMGLGDLAGAVDFTLAFAVVHEFPDAESFFAQAARAMKPGARLLLAAPRGHVDEGQFRAELDAARRAGLAEDAGPDLARSWTALLRREG